MDPVAQYLQRYAEPSATLEVPGTHRRALVIPVKDEPEIPAVAVAPDVLKIVVVNDQAELPKIPGAFVVDARAERGVGLARKIGCDLALSLWTRGQLREPWIHTTDADAVPPAEAFDADPPDAVALSLPLWHEPCGDPRIDRATVLYEVWLRYYVAGLGWAGSPWAFLTVGSAMAMRAEAYAAVRGVPRREAGGGLLPADEAGQARPRRDARRPPGADPFTAVDTSALWYRARRGEDPRARARVLRPAGVRSAPADPRRAAGGARAHR